MTGLLDNLLSSVKDTYARTVNQVFNSLGRNIGYFTDDQQLARGQLNLYAGETIGDPNTWVVTSPLGYDVPASVYLVNKGLQPSWLSPSQATALLAQTASPIAPLLSPPPAVPAPSTVPAVIGGSLTGSHLASWALIGGFGVASLVILTRRRRR